MRHALEAAITAVIGAGLWIGSTAVAQSPPETQPRPDPVPPPAVSAPNPQGAVPSETETPPAPGGGMWMVVREGDPGSGAASPGEAATPSEAAATEQAPTPVQTPVQTPVPTPEPSPEITVQAAPDAASASVPTAPPSPAARAPVVDGPSEPPEPPRTLARPQEPPPPRSEQFGQFSFEVAQGLLLSICQSAAEDASTPAALAGAAGLQTAEAPDFVKRTLPADAVTWAAESTDSQVYLYAHSGAAGCGVIIARPLSDAAGPRLRSALTQTESRFEKTSEETLDESVLFTRFRSPAGRYVDVLEYPARGEQPGLIKAEFLRG
ncbi:hypothetical protein GC169_06480 [bacterium]|nr:hypothetical protein [bacterium]